MIFKTLVRKIVYRLEEFYTTAFPGASIMYHPKSKACNSMGSRGKLGLLLLKHSMLPQSL